MSVHISVFALVCYICVFPYTHVSLVCAFSAFAKKYHELCVQRPKFRFFQYFQILSFSQNLGFFSSYLLIHNIAVHYYVSLIRITQYINLLQLFNVYEYILPSFPTILNYVPQILSIAWNPVWVFLRLPPLITLNFLCH